MDFFSILLPGALLAYFVKDRAGPLFLGSEYYRLLGAQGWIAFLFSAYLLGHFAFLLSAWLFDDYVYDAIRKGTDHEQIRRLAKGEPRSLLIVGWLAAWLFKGDTGIPVQRVVQIKDHYLAAIHGSAAIKAFQWSNAKLTVEHPETMRTVQRFEADSKFVRSLVIVLV